MNLPDRDPDRTPAPPPPSNRAFDAGRAWNEAVVMLKANRQVLTVLAGLFFLVPQVLLSALMPDVAPGLEGEEAAKAALAIFASWWPLILLATLLQGVGMLAIIVLLADRARPTVRDAIGRAFRLLPSYIAATLVLVAGIGLCALLILIPLTLIAGQAGAGIAMVPIMIAALWVNVRTITLAPLVGAERETNPFDALRRSWALTNGRGGSILTFMLLFVIAALVLSIVITAIPGAVLIAALGQDTGGAIAGLIEGLVSAALLLVWSVVVLAIYRQLAG